MAIGVGGVVPHLTSGPKWPYRLLGLGCGVLAAAIFMVGTIRQQRGEKALQHGGYDQLVSPLVTWITVAAVALTMATLTLLAIGT